MPISFKLFFAKLGRPLFFIILIIISGLIATVISGILMAMGGNIQAANLQIIFDPQITIAYILLSYFLGYYYHLTQKQAYFFFLFALFLSYTTNFIQGSIMLVIIPLLLKKFKLINSTPVP